MGLKINGSTSGSIEIDVPAVAGTNTAITIPATTGGEFIVSDSSGNVDLGALDISGSAAADSVVIDSSGDVQIGTTAPFGGNVANRGHLTLNGTNDFKVQWGTGGTERGYLYADATNLSIINTQNGYLRLNTNNTERMRITNAGYLKASTNTADTSIYTAGTHHTIHTDNNNWSIIVDNSHDSQPYGIRVDFSDAAPDNNTQSFFLGRDSSTDRFRVWADGDCDNHDNSYGGFSDEKLKQDIVDAGSQWDDVKNLRVRKFKFKSDVELYGAEAKTLIGVVAQETELVSPGLVKTAIDFDDEGNDLGTTTKAVRYSVLYMKAVKALQEAMERIETLETANASLEARLTALEGGAS
jgi:hypothetical protein